MSDNKTERYEFNYYPEDENHPDINLTFYQPKDLHCSKIQEMCRAFAAVLGYSSATIDKYLGEEHYEDEMD